jgi:NAD(P)-dependent dehydrogenase (short-subunit alcohol dehydrogenase family)
MKHVVITGSTRGIGYGLAQEFLQAGCKVIINGRSQKSVEHALNSLRVKDASFVDGFAATTDQRENMESLWNFAEQKLGKLIFGLIMPGSIRRESIFGKWMYRSTNKSFARICWESFMAVTLLSNICWNKDMAKFLTWRGLAAME